MDSWAGQIKFLTERGGTETERPFIRAAANTFLDAEASHQLTQQLVSHVFETWQLNPPDIIISIVSGVTYFQAWKRAEDRNALRKGIIKLINKTDVWLVDHGLNCGISKLIAEAVRSQREMLRKQANVHTCHRPQRLRHRLRRRHAKTDAEIRADVYSRKHDHDDHKMRGTCLLGVVPDLLLSDGTNLNNSARDEGRYHQPSFSEHISRRASQQAASQSATETRQSGAHEISNEEEPEETATPRARFELNQDHSAFVLVNNSDYVRTAIFRTQFERALQHGAVVRKLAAVDARHASVQQKKSLRKTAEELRRQRISANENRQRRRRRRSSASSLSSNSTTFSSDISLDELVERNITIDNERRQFAGAPLPDSGEAEKSSLSRIPTPTTSAETIHVDKVPLVCCMLQGGPPEIDHILFYLKDRVPVVCLKGTGLMADIVAFAYDEIIERGGGVSKLLLLSAATNQQQPHPAIADAMSAIKPDLSRRLSHNFPRQFARNDAVRNVYRDRILECVKLAFQDGHQYLTVVDVQSIHSDLADLDLFILRALFSSRMRNLLRLPRHVRDDLLRKHLILCISWNRPDVARHEIFYHPEWDCMHVDYHIFELALLLKGREEFVDMFLSQKYHIYKHLTHRSLLRLYRKADDRAFFLTIVWERILGKSKRSQVKQRFVFEDVNWLIETLTGK